MMNVKEIVEATGGYLLHGDPAQKVSGVSTDSRTVLPKNLFIALKGKNFDGHRFLSSAACKKASVLLVSQKPKKRFLSASVVVVKDTSRALECLARFHRLKFSIPVIAITGSSGKTTTKELIASVLKKKFNVLKSLSTENNFIGVSKTLLNLRVKHDVVVLEFGTNHFGEIKNLTRIAQPTISILTNVGESHLEFLKTLAGVFKEKKEIYKNLSEEGIVLFNGDDLFLEKIKSERIKAEKIAFSIQKKSDYQAKNIRQTNEGIEFFVGSKKFLTKTFSISNIYNALCAIVIGRLFRISIKEINGCIAQAHSLKQRQNLYRTKKKFWMIDDTYNANPLSVRSAVESLVCFPAKGKRIFVFGDMNELGLKSKMAHKSVGRQVGKSNIDCFVTVGRKAKLATEEMKNKNIQKVNFSSCQSASKFLSTFIQPDDIVLIKGSRSVRLEEIVRKIG